VIQLRGTIAVLPPPYTQADPTPFLQLTNVAAPGSSKASYDLTFDPDFSKQSLLHIFYTAGTPNHDRVSRFTADAD